MFPLIAILAFTQFTTIHQLELTKYKDFKLPSKEYRKPIPFKPKPKTLNRTVYGFLPYWRLSNAYLIRWDLLTHIACFGIELNAFGEIADTHGWPSNWVDVIDSAHTYGVQVHLTVIVFDPDVIHSILSNPVYRDNAINSILEQVNLGNADGVNIDFEFPYASDRELVNEFMSILADSLHSQNKELTIDVPAINWSERFDPYTLAQITDGLFIMGYDFHWSGSDEAGPVAPLTGWTYNVTGSVQYWVTQSGNARDKIILGVPYYGYNWPTVGPNPHSATTGIGNAVVYQTAYYEALSYGRLWDTESQTPWYRYQQSGQWYQTWYDDDTSIGLKYDLVNSQDLQGAGMWALTYDGTRPELWDAIASHFSQGAPPPQPSGLAVLLTGPGSITVSWYPVNNASGYDVFISSDGINFSLAEHVYSNIFQISGLVDGEIRFFKVRATNAFGNSPFTEVLAAVSSSSSNQILIVNGFDRTSGTINTFDFIKEHGTALLALGLPFNSSSNERIEDSSVVLNDYLAVDWILGEEGTSTMSFSPLEQTRVIDYLTNGGYLFLSGSEIGYDLWEQGSQEDRLFYNSFLKAEYLGDDANTHSAIPVSGEIFDGLWTVHFDDGTHGYYDVDYPDGVGPYDGSVSCITYTGNTGWSAGIAFDGTSGNDTVTGKIVYLGFPIETVYDSLTRLVMFADVFNFFGFDVYAKEISTTLPHTPKILSVPSIVKVPGILKLKVYKQFKGSIRLFDLAGREISLLKTGDFRIGFLEIPLSRVSTGVYFIRIYANDGKDLSSSQKIIIFQQ